MSALVANAAWAAACLPEVARFHRATSRVGDSQLRLLRDLLRDNAETEFGREHRFAAIRTVADYQAAVPPRTYDELEPWIARAAAGARGVLTRQRIRLFEPTSGSAAATKLIPYTHRLQREFQRAIRAWVGDLFLSRPGLMTGRAYWSITPPAGLPGRTAAGIPIGFDDDAAYLGGWQRRLVGAAMVRPDLAAGNPGGEAFQYRTLLALVASEDLRLVSVWNPAFLSLLVERLPEWGEALGRDLADRRRAAVLRDALGTPTPGERHAILWPRLALISCWTDANAASSASRLCSLFPQAGLQGKGLIATEAFVSLPIAGVEGHALAVRSHFFEFVPVDSAGTSAGGGARLADELEAGRRYAVLVSTGGGLYRYRLQDVVEVVGCVRQCPLIRFVGREGYVSDWFGEKLNDAHVARALRAAFDAEGLAPAFSMLACDTALTTPAYVLYVEAGAADAALGRVAARVEQGLRANFHYDRARLLGQLGGVRVFRTSGAAGVYLSAAVAAGQRAGSVKPPALHRLDGWSRVFRGRLLPDPAAPAPVSTADLAP